MQKQVGLKIKELRNVKLWTQEQLSEISGVNVRTIGRLEAGKNVESATLLSVLNALDTTLQELESPTLSEGSVDGDETNETKKQESLQFLQRIEDGRNLVRIIADSHQYGFDYHDCETKEKIEEVQSFLTNVADVIDIWSMVEIGQRFDLENTLDEQIKTLEKLNLWVFGLRQHDEKANWTTAIIQVYSKDNPMIRKIKLDKTLMPKQG
ncbi:helix-turn-helix transcriptional regulator [Sporosarcina sp. Marseille-Q4063]|uniref:helix-turn-helix transcriptional regulator n=1 Tax=Sporosarcina sp. Marseille-Q4063 TaxID=2810514 RepID=UPI001BAF6901|nr:helix-turn-helix transcriptional regulator [Sporosarcina sp. Marseille-Q4063]QUW23620.1 helix-turn-helix transcriptional regulator [Sporosarcina sp. Marseille-Q4063]